MTTALRTSAEKALTDVIPFTRKAELNVPLVLGYTSTFLPDGKETTVTTWAELMQHVGSMVLNQGGPESDREYLAKWFTDAVVVLSNGSTIEAMTVSFDTYAPHGMSTKQVYTVSKA